MIKYISFDIAYAVIITLQLLDIIDYYNSYILFYNLC